MKPVVIDTDPGTDDALAIMMALNSPDLDVLGLTTVGGNARLADTTRNALRILENVGRADVPVARGAARPLRGRHVYAYQVHGSGGLTVRLPEPKLQPVSESAIEFLVRSAFERQAELTVIALGPLTNVAKAVMHEPRFTDWVAELIVMGGAVGVPGNVTEHAEFNIYSDPSAASVVFDSGIPTALVGLDVTTRANIARTDAPWFDGDRESARLAGRILDNWFTSHPDRERFHLHDPLAVAAAIEPELLTYRQARVSVDTESQERLGQTTAEFGDGPIMVATDVHAGRSRELIKRLL